MTEKSVICNFMSNNMDDWESILKEQYSIKIKKLGRLALFLYSIESDFSNPIVQEARGIIIDTETLVVVCWPFRKFGNHNEGYVDSIDWNSARVQEKVDGSIIKLWNYKELDGESNKWQFSTNGVIRAEDASVEGVEGLSYMDIIKKAENFKDIPFDKLDKDYTYIFELVSPETQVVIDYGKTMLYHLGTRNNITGEELEVDIGIIKPKEYQLDSLANCIKAVNELNKGNDVQKEGFVVVDKNWNRVKIKSAKYLTMHHVTVAQTITKKECIELLLNDPEQIDFMCNGCLEIIPIVKYYEFRIAELFHNATKMARLAQKLYEEYSHERKAVAEVISKHKLAMIGFRCMEGAETAEHALKAMPIEKFCKLIPDYVPEDFSLLFAK